MTTTQAAPPAAPGTAPPNWVDDRTALGWAISRVLEVAPLRQLLFAQARRMMIRTAERQGIAWDERREELRHRAEPLLAASTDPATVAPAYFQAPFHAYPEGNLCWEAACEAEQATAAVALRLWAPQGLGPEAAQERMRDAIFAAIEPSLPDQVRHALDMGCSVGVGTRALKERLDARGQGEVAVEGVDLSPQMLAVARVLDPQGTIRAWHHAAAEDTRLPAASFDLITLQLLCHELPADATRAVLREAARLLRPGGAVAVADQDPDAPAIRGLPAPLATLLKSTEPYLAEYFGLDLAAALAEAGFTRIRREACSPRHRVLVANLPEEGPSGPR